MSLDRQDMMMIDEVGSDENPAGYSGHDQSPQSMTLKRGKIARSGDIATEKNSGRNSVSGARSPVSGVSKVGKMPRNKMNEDDEFRQQIEKEDLDKILNQEIEYEDDELALAGGIASKSNQGRGEYSRLSRKNKDQSPIIIPDTENKQSNQPGYRRPTIEAKLKDIRNQKLIEQQNIDQAKKENPNLRFTSSKDYIENQKQQARELITLGGPSSNEGSHTPMFSYGKTTRKQSAKVAQNIHPSSNIISDANLGNTSNEHFLTDKLKSRGLSSTLEQMDSTYAAQHGLLSKQDIRASLILHKSDQEIIYEELKQSFDQGLDQEESIMDRKRINKKNFGLPSNKYVLKHKKSKEFRNRSKSNEKNKDITMYIGAVNIVDQQEKVTANKKKYVTPIKQESEYNYRNASKEDSSKIIISAKAAANLNLSIEENIHAQWIPLNNSGDRGGLDESMQSAILGTKNEVSKRQLFDPQILGTGSQSSYTSNYLRESKENTLRKRGEKEELKSIVQYRNLHQNVKINNDIEMLKLREEDYDQSIEIDQVRYFAIKKQRKVSSHQITKQQVHTEPQILNQVTQFSDTDETKQAQYKSNVGPGGEILRLAQLKKTQEAERKNDPELIRAEMKQREEKSKAAKELFDLQNQKLVSLQGMIKTMTPQSKIHKIDFTHMDERATIEYHNKSKLDLIHKIMKKSLNLKHKSCSPKVLKTGHNFSNSNLKFIKHRNNSGNIEDTYSMTTQIISGHNTPLAYLKKKKEKLHQINQDQDDLLKQLREKERRLALNSVKASKLFHSFVSNQESNDVILNQQTFQRIKKSVENASESMFVHKMKPLQTTRSFDSWRSQVEKDIEEGLTFTDKKQRSMPKRFEKHMVQINQKIRQNEMEGSQDRKQVKRIVSMMDQKINNEIETIFAAPEKRIDLLDRVRKRLRNKAEQDPTRQQQLRIQEKSITSSSVTTKEMKMVQEFNQQKGVDMIFPSEVVIQNQKLSKVINKITEQSNDDLLKNSEREEIEMKSDPPNVLLYDLQENQNIEEQIRIISILENQNGRNKAMNKTEQQHVRNQIERLEEPQLYEDEELNNPTEVISLPNNQDVISHPNDQTISVQVISHPKNQTLSYEINSRNLNQKKQEFQPLNLPKWETIANNDISSFSSKPLQGAMRTSGTRTRASQRGEVNSGSVSKGNMLNTIQQPQRLKTRNDRKSLGLITTLEKKDLDTNNSSEMDYCHLKMGIQNKMKPKSATAQARKMNRGQMNNTMMMSQQENQMQSINEYVISQKMIQKNESQAVSEQEEIESPSKVKRNSIRGEEQPSNQKRISIREEELPSKLELKRNSTSLWKENFKIRNEIGYENYNKLSRYEQKMINDQIKERFPNETWARKKDPRKSKDKVFSAKLSTHESARLTNIPASDQQAQDQLQSYDSNLKSNIQNSEMPDYLYETAAPVKRRQIKTFAQTSRSVKYIGPKDKKREQSFNTLMNYDYVKIAKRLDRSQQNQIDMIDRNKEMVKHPESMRLTNSGLQMHIYRQNQRGYLSVRQCDCLHQDLKQKQPFDNIITINKKQLNGINSKMYNSIEATSNLRLKPIHSIDRTAKMTTYFKQNTNNYQSERDFPTFMTQIDDDIIKKHFNMKRTLDPSTIYDYSDVIAALSGTDPQVLKNFNTSNLCDLIKACSDTREQNKSEMQDQFSILNQAITENKQIHGQMGKLGEALGKYIDIEKVQMENFRNKQHLKRQSMASQVSSNVSSMDNLKLMIKKKSSVNKEMLKMKTIQLPPEDKDDDKEPLVSLKDVYVDMIRNQRLDFENFQGKQVIAKAIEQKNKSTKKVMEYKTKIWKQKYSEVIPEQILNNCDFY